MRILAVGAMSDFYVNRLKIEAESRGYVMDVCSAGDLCVETGTDILRATVNGVDVFTYDIIHPVALATYRWPWSAVFRYAKQKFGVQIIDPRNTDATFGEYSGLAKYFLEHDHGIPLPKTFSFKYAEHAERVMKEGMFTFPVIVKNTSSKKGRGVLLANSFEEVREFVSNILTEDRALGFVLREYIPNDGDYRVNVIGNQVAAVFKRTPKRGEFRSNISQGGALKFVPSNAVPEVCRVAVEITKLAKCDIAGVDVMVHAKTGVPYVLEVNRAPEIDRNDEAESGINLAAVIVNLYEKKVAIQVK